MKLLRKKIQSFRGETLIEALVALVIVVLAISLLSTALSTSARINRSNNDQVKTLSVIGGAVTAPTDSKGLTFQATNIDNLIYNGDYQGTNVEFTITKDGVTLEDGDYSLQYNTTKDDDTKWTDAAPGLKDAGEITVRVKVTLTENNAEYFKSYTLSVQKCPVTMTSGSDSIYKGDMDKDYFSVEKVTAVGFADGEGASYENYTKLTEVTRDAPNEFDYVLWGNTNESNYEIKKIYGHLAVLANAGLVCQTIEPAYPFEYTPAIADNNFGPPASDIKVYYDGKELDSDEYTISYSTDSTTDVMEEKEWTVSTGLINCCEQTPLYIRATAKNDDYGIAYTAVYVTITQATPEFKSPSLIATAGAKLSDDLLSVVEVTCDGVTVLGALKWNDYVTISEGGGDYKATFTPENPNIKTLTDVTFTVHTILKAKVYQWPTAGSITYGQALKDSRLVAESAGASTDGTNDSTKKIAGSFKWANPEETPSAGKDKTYSMYFDPDNSEQYTRSDSQLVTITVNKATPVYYDSDTKANSGAVAYLESIVKASNIAITNGITPSGSVTLSANGVSTSSITVNLYNEYTHDEVAGTLSVDSVDYTSLVIGSNKDAVKVTWTPNDADNYNEVSFYVDVTGVESDLQKAIVQYGKEMEAYTSSNLVYSAISSETYKDEDRDAEDSMEVCKISNYTNYIYSKHDYHVIHDKYYWIKLSDLRSKFIGNTSYNNLPSTANSTYKATIAKAIETYFTNLDSSIGTSFTPITIENTNVKATLKLIKTNNTPQISATFEDTISKETKTINYDINTYRKDPINVNQTKKDISGFKYTDDSNNPQDMVANNWWSDDGSYSLDIHAKITGNTYTFKLSASN